MFRCLTRVACIPADEECPATSSMSPTASSLEVTKGQAWGFVVSMGWPAARAGR